MMKVEKRKLAEGMFVEREMTLTSIAQMLKVPLTTLSRWKQKYGWDKLKTARLRSRVGIEQTLADVLERKVEQLKGMSPEEVNAKVIDGLYKLIAGIKKIEKEGDPLGETISVFDGFSKYVSNRGAGEKFREELSRWMSGYVESLM